MPNIASASAYDSPLELCMLDGDLTGVMDLIDAMDASERASSLVTVDRLIGLRWGWIRQEAPNPLNTRPGYGLHSENRFFRAVELAHFMCSVKRPRADYWMHIGLQDIATFKQRYNPAPAGPLTEKMLRGDHRWHYRNHVHRAVIAGLIERPQTDEYLQSLFFGDLRHHSNIVLQHVDADPGLAPYLLQLFDHEGNADSSFAAVEKYCHAPELYWSHAFIALCERGVYTRTQLLDKTLGALACDWAHFKSGWFSRFHDILSPSVEEMTPFAARYLALCHSRIAPTVSLAMAATAQLYKVGHVDAAQLCEALQPVITSATKGQVLSALELLGLVVKHAPERAPAVSAIAVHALSHSGSDVQKKAIACLQTWGLDSAGQQVARDYLPFVAAVNQPSLIKLVGGAVTPHPSDAGAPAPIAPVTPTTLRPLDPSRTLQALTHILDLIERTAYVLENPVDVDEWERVAAALVRLAPIQEPDQGAFKAVMKRAMRMHRRTQPLGYALAQLLACALEGECAVAEVMALQADQGINAETFIAWRAHSLITQAAAGMGLTPLSTPTHRGGFIDPRQLVARIAAYQQAGVQAAMSEQVFALLRLVPASVDSDAASAALQAVRTLKEQPIVQAVRHALGGDVRIPTGVETRALFVAAARIRAPGNDDAGTLTAFGNIGPDGPASAKFDWHVTRNEPNDGGHVFHTLCVTLAPVLQTVDEHHYAMALCAKHASGPRWGTESNAASIRFAANLVPSGLESFFAESTRVMGNNLDWWEAQWQNRAYLDVLLEPTTPYTPMASLTLAVALAGKEPGQTALAVDALVRGVQEARVDATALGESLARLWATPLVKGPRYGKSLAAAARAHSSMPAVVFPLLCAMVVVKPDAPRKDMTSLLELLLELKLANQLDLPTHTRECLAAMQLSGKSKVAVNSLLD